METWEGKNFSITDPKGVKTVIYQVNKTEKEFLETSPKYTIERLDSIEELIGNNTKRTFYVENVNANNNQILILSFAKDRVVINNGILEKDRIRISKKPTPFKFNILYSEEPQEYREVRYTPNLKRPISIIDPETTEEVKPMLYFDGQTNEVKGKCKLKPYKSYFVFELREENGKINLVGGSPKITD